jgi:hypothetical protein
MQDLVILVADKNMQFALQGALSRPQALSIRQLSFEFRSHMGRDGGVRTTGASVLGSEKVRFRHALMILDHEGCGQETASVQQLLIRPCEFLSSIFDVSVLEVGDDTFRGLL